MFLTIAVTVGIVGVVVGVHFLALTLASMVVEALPGRNDTWVAVAIVLMLVAHLFEVVLFAFAWHLLFDLGHLNLLLITEAQPGVVPFPRPTFTDLCYFSGVVYSSLGFGDIVPTGTGRLLAIVESVTGLVLIAWTASFTYVIMRSEWDRQLQPPG